MPQARRKITNPNGMPQNLSPRIPIWEKAKRNRTLTLTDTAWEKLEAIAASFSLSRSEFLENLMRKSSLEDYEKVLEKAKKDCAN